MTLRDRKLRRLGWLLFVSWLCLLPVIVVALQQSSLSSEPLWVLVLAGAAASLVVTLDLLSEYSGFSFAYEGRQIPAMLFTGIRFVVAALLFAAAHYGLSSVNVNLSQLFASLKTFDLSSENTRVVLGIVLFLAGFAFNRLLFCAFAFVRKGYNGKAFLVINILDTVIGAAGLALLIVTLADPLKKIQSMAGSASVFNVSQILSSPPWWAWVAGIGLLVSVILKIVSFMIGYAPASNWDSERW